MKKFLIIGILIISIPAYSACLIDANADSICSLSGTQNNTSSIMQPTNQNINMNDLQSTTNLIEQDNGLNNSFPRLNNSLMQYNSGCQFGICVQDLNNVKNQNQ